MWLRIGDPIKHVRAIKQTPGRKLREIHMPCDRRSDSAKNRSSRAISMWSRLAIGHTEFLPLLAVLVNSASSLNPHINPQETLNRRNIVIQAMAHSTESRHRRRKTRRTRHCGAGDQPRLRAEDQSSSKPVRSSRRNPQIRRGIYLQSVHRDGAAVVIAEKPCGQRRRLWIGGRDGGLNSLNRTP
jgi:hypothetical protein